ncbi:MAG TPA: hypothetical protein VEH07_06395 [Alphaproteobacteria bacterium]|nr:hypothetical protein [Alphaproteobacteria bacterium]
MFGRLRVALRPIIGCFGLFALATPLPAAAASAGIACAGLSSLSALVDVLRENGIDPLIATPGGIDPVSVAVVPADSDAAEQAAQAFQLRRLEPAGEGESRETMILPRLRPNTQAQTETAAEKPVKPEAPTPGLATSAAYRTFIAGLATLAKLRLDDPKNLARAKALLVKSDLISLAHAWLAQCAEIASHSDAFVDGVEKAAAAGADQLNSNIEKQPGTALNIGGWQSASLAIRQEIAKDIQLMESISFRLSEISYGRAGGEAHFAELANRGDITSAAPAGAPSPASVSPTLNERAKPLMAQMLALGAHMHLAKEASATGPDPLAATLVTNKDNDQCFRWAQLNLDQCMAAARDNQERAYCLGKQGIDERVKCWSVLLGASS